MSALSSFLNEKKEHKSTQVNSDAKESKKSKKTIKKGKSTPKEETDTNSFRTHKCDGYNCRNVLTSSRLNAMDPTELRIYYFLASSKINLININI
jgi:hypothetical protein